MSLRISGIELLHTCGTKPHTPRSGPVKIELSFKAKSHKDKDHPHWEIEAMAIVTEQTSGKQQYKGLVRYLAHFELSDPEPSAKDVAETMWPLLRNELETQCGRIAKQPLNLPWDIAEFYPDA